MRARVRAPLMRAHAGAQVSDVLRAPLMRAARARARATHARARATHARARAGGQVSDVLQVPRNFMFITCPGPHFPHDFGLFGGIRVITH